MVTIKDVAKRAGVAISTVSYALNNSKSLKPETVMKVKEAVKELGYRPNLIARSLKTRSTSTIGVIIPDIANTFFAQIIRGIEDVSERKNHSVILCNTYENPKKEENYIDLLLNRDIDGLILVGTGHNPETLTGKEDLPIVIVDRQLGQSVPSVTVNNRKGGYLATQHLLEKKSGEILFLSGPLGINTYLERLNGYLDALNEAGIPRHENLIRECGVNYDGGQDVMSDIMEKNLKFDSVFASNDLIALGAYNILIRKGIRVPQDIQIIGYDDIPTSHIVTPGLSTIRQPTYHMGKTSAEILFDIISGGSTVDEHIVLEPTLIPRETT
ncbi:MAG: LacI family transcriptional regulator [Candidatus Zixiibacteriota bacterium]|nr:MAG: LacI family transcriptional regulator [candidate division Zixibacteria bacterium]